jgi:hypothetical protein
VFSAGYDCVCAAQAPVSAETAAALPQ